MFNLYIEVTLKEVSKVRRLRKRRYRQFFGWRWLPDDLIIGDYAFKVNASTEFIYMFYARQGMKVTAPDSTGHWPQIAGNCGTDRSNRPTPPLAITQPAATQLPHVPTGCGAGARQAGYGGPPAGRGAVIGELAAAARPVTGTPHRHGQRSTELHNPRIMQETNHDRRLKGK